MVPVTAPGLVRKSPRMLMDPNFPLFVRWRYLPRLAPWLRRYLSNANDSDTRRIARGLTPIVSDSVEQHQNLCDDLGLGDWVTHSDYCFAYRDRSAFEAESYTWGLRKEAGFTPRLIEGAEIADYDPSLGPDIKCLAVLGHHGFIRNPGGYVRALAQALADMGARIVTDDVHDFEITDGRVTAVRTRTADFHCDDVVLATGVWSKPLLRKLGINVPLETERGYHIVFEGATGGPKRPVMVASGKFVATPMEQGIRCAGILEFGGLEAGPSPAPLQLLRRHAKLAFPNLEAAREVEWLGHRPAPSDSLPLIGQIGESGVYCAFGHHHIGLTGGPKTGRLVAGLIGGQSSNVDLSPYHPQRFGGA